MIRAAALVLALLAPAAALASTPEERGRAVYNYRCYFCHGYSGDARTLAATFLEPRPRDFQATAAREMPLPRIVGAITRGVPGTAMKGFEGILGASEIAEVAQFVRSEFLVKRAPNTRYHTVENGWPGHERYAAAYPFARGEIALDSDDRRLAPRERAGKALYLSTCITCHDRARVERAGPVWQSR